jgi:ribosome-binding factor A
MTIKQERLKEIIREIASRNVTEWSQNFDHTFWIISIVEVDLAKDKSYADIYLAASKTTDWLAKALVRIAKDIQWEIGRELMMRKNPTIRFRVKKWWKNPVDILALIESLDKQYDLSH